MLTQTDSNFQSTAKHCLKSYPQFLLTGPVPGPYRQNCYFCLFRYTALSEIPFSLTSSRCAGHCCNLILVNNLVTL